MANLVDVVLETRDAIEANISANLAPENIEWPNESFTTPNNIQWMRVTYNNIGTVSTDASLCYEIIAGILSIDFFYPRFSALIPALTEAEDMKKALLETIYDDVVILGANITNPGPTGSWYQVQLNINYQYEGFVNAN